MTTERPAAAFARVHDRCRVCGWTRLVRYLDMGATPLANSYVRPERLDELEPSAELAIQLCTSCGLSQLTRVVDPDVMFRDYLYVSSTTRTFRDHCAELAETSMRVAGAARGDLALDIASNDGLLLSRFQGIGMRVLGVDPARNLAAEANARGIATIPEYWSAEIARDAVGSHGRPAVVTATNVLAHVDDLHAFVAGVASVLAEEGIFVVEVPYLLDLIERNEFDTAYHEHLSYFALHPARELFRGHGLEVFDVERFPDIHGGTIRIFSARAGRRPVSRRVTEVLEQERGFGITDPAPHVAFGRRSRDNVAQLRSLVADLAARGDVVWAYGASAKGNTLMNFSGLTSASVPVAVDDNPKKWGLYTPGAHMRIAGSAELATSRVDHLLLLAWNFEAEIVRRSRDAGYRGGYIRPVPAVALIGAAAALAS